jgi:hydrogenase maturation factor HypF (carbamoyltransferase family)
MSYRASSDTRFMRFPIIECAQCGERLFVPEWSEYLDHSRVRHFWQCEACGYAFESVVFCAPNSS